MRMGAPVYGDFKSAAEWVQAHKKRGYNAAYSPINSMAELKTKEDYVKEARKNDLIIAEVGAWSNPLSPEKSVSEAAYKNCAEKLFIADEIGAECCVNIAGNRGAGKWDSHSPENYGGDAFDAVVESVRKIIDAVSPKRTFYTLEMMPWMLPFDADSYLALIRAVDREKFAVHLDMVNTINSPEKFYKTGEITSDIFNKLGGYIKSIHVKDIDLSPGLTVHLSEVLPGRGGYDFKTLVGEVRKTNPEIPMMLEHLPSESDYELAAEHLKKFL